MSTAAAHAAYEALAAAYDERVAPSAWVRERLWARLDALFPPGARVLDATAGTGLDAVHLAERGVAVTACDLSPAMLARLARKLPGVPTFAGDLNALDQAPLAGPFDGVISTFAGVNAAADLAGFARAAARLVRPGGILFLHALNRWPVAELVRRLRPGGRLGAALRASLRGERKVSIEGIAVPHRLWTPGGLARVFGADFRLVRVAGQAVVRRADALTPVPSPGDGRGGRLRGDRFEAFLAGLPLIRGLGTFFSLEMVRR